MIAQEDIKVDYFQFGGGLNQVGPAMLAKPGEVLDSINYEPDVAGGYRRTRGYERFDGRPRPSDAIASGVACSLATVPAAGDALVCGAKSAVFVQAIGGGMLVTGSNGIFPPSTAITVAGVEVGTTAAQPNLLYADSALAEAEALYACGEVRRAPIAAVPGSGPVRGVWMLGGAVFAVRDNAGATAGVIHRASAAGWVAVPLYAELKFTAGQATTFAEGDTVKGATSGATATVKRQLRESGLYDGGTAVGRLIVQPIAGTFAPGELLKSSVDAYAATRATATGPAAAITIAPGGRYETVSHNFYGQANTRRVYGVSGVDRAFEFDGAVYVPINTGAVDDRPAHVIVHKNYLFVSLAASAMNSSVGNPFEWQALTGAVETAVGAEITGFRVLRGEPLGIFTNISAYQLLGSASDKWDLQSLSPDSGAQAGTMQNVTSTFALDNRGITQYEPTQKYGNFEFDTVSRKVQALIDAIRGQVIGSYIVRQRNQYRLLLGDGQVVVLAVRDATSRDFMLIKYRFTPACVCSDTELASGVERIFMGAADGMVYEMDRGSSYDGAPIEAYLRMWHYASRSPRVRKRYRKALVEMTTQLYSKVAAQAYFSYGDNEIQATASDSILALGAGAVWDTADWDTFFWDGEQVSQPSFRIDGTGTNISLLFYSNTAIDQGHLLQGVTLHFTPRRLQR